MDTQLLANLLAQINNTTSTSPRPNSLVTLEGQVAGGGGGGIDGARPDFLSLIQNALAAGGTDLIPDIATAGSNLPGVSSGGLPGSAQSLLDKSALPSSLVALNEMSTQSETGRLLENGIYTYVQEQWFEGVGAQAKRETLQQYSITEAEYEALPLNSELRLAIDKSIETSTHQILAERLNQARENAIMEIVDIRTRMRAQVLGQQGISPDEFNALSPARQAELEAMVRKEMLKLQELLRDGYTLTEAFQRVATA